jgi:hypothetical protein
MRVSSVTGALALALAIVMPAYAQTPSRPPAANSGQQQAAMSKRAACEASTPAQKGSDNRDQMQLCLAQARIDCLKQAIDQKLFGKPRTDFVKNCMGEQPAK